MEWPGMYWKRGGWWGGGGGWPDPPSSYGLPLNPLAPKPRKKILPQTVEGETGGGSEGGGGRGVQVGRDPSPYGCQPF